MSDPQPTNVNAINSTGLIVVPWAIGMQAGAGYDSVGEVVKGGALDGTVSFSGSKVPMKVDYIQQKIESTEELSDSLSIDVSASGGYAGFKASAESTYSTSKVINNYSLFFLMAEKVVSEPKYIDTVALSAAARGMNAQEFRTKFGDFFVYGFIGGGVFYGVLELKTDSEQTKRDIGVSVSASYDGAFSVGGKFAMDMKNAASHKGVNLSIHVGSTGTTGAWTESKDFSDVDNFAELANGFAAAVGDAGQPLLAILKPYSLLADSPIGDTAFNFALDAQRRELLAIVQRGQQMLNSIEYALNYRQEFPPDELASLTDLRAQIEQTMELAKQADGELRDNPDAKVDLGAIALPPLSTLPKRFLNLTLKEIAPPTTPLTPGALGFTVARAQLAALGIADEKPRNAELAYLTQIGSDVTTNWGNAYSFHVKLLATIPALQHEISATVAQDLVKQLSDTVAQGNAAWTQAVANQKAQFDALKGEFGSSTDLALMDQVNATVWRDQDGAYAGANYWTSLSDVVADLTGIVAQWDVTASGSQYFSFATGLWKLASETLHDAMLRFDTSSSARAVAP